MPKLSRLLPLLLLLPLGACLSERDSPTGSIHHGTASLEHCALFDRPAVPTRTGILQGRQRGDCVQQ